MRGSKNGLEKWIRETVCCNHLDIDGDSCHHIHNACKQLTSCFNSYLEELFSSLFTDIKWSEDQRVVLESICSHLGITYRCPELYFGTHWWTVQNIPVQHQYDMDALVAFYFSFLSKEEHCICRDCNKFMRSQQMRKEFLQSKRCKVLIKKQHTEAGRKSPITCLIQVKKHVYS